MDERGWLCAVGGVLGKMVESLGAGIDVFGRGLWFGTVANAKTADVVTVANAKTADVGTVVIGRWWLG